MTLAILTAKLKEVTPFVAENCLSSSDEDLQTGNSASSTELIE
jgi:hypothetical protein